MLCNKLKKNQCAKKHLAHTCQVNLLSDDCKPHGCDDLIFDLLLMGKSGALSKIWLLQPRCCLHFLFAMFMQGTIGIPCCHHTLLLAIVNSSVNFHHGRITHGQMFWKKCPTRVVVALANVVLCLERSSLHSCRCNCSLVRCDLQR